MRTLGVAILSPMLSVSSYAATFSCNTVPDISSDATQRNPTDIELPYFRFEYRTTDYSVVISFTDDAFEMRRADGRDMFSGGTATHETGQVFYADERGHIWTYWVNIFPYGIVAFKYDAARSTLIRIDVGAAHERGFDPPDESLKTQVDVRLYQCTVQAE